MEQGEQGQGTRREGAAMGVGPGEASRWVIVYTALSAIKPIVETGSSMQTA